MDPKATAVSKAMDTAKAAALKNSDKIQSVKVKVKFGGKMEAIKRKAKQFGDGQKYGKS